MKLLHLCNFRPKVHEFCRCQARDPFLRCSSRPCTRTQNRQSIQSVWIEIWMFGRSLYLPIQHEVFLFRNHTNGTKRIPQCKAFLMTLRFQDCSKATTELACLTRKLPTLLFWFFHNQCSSQDLLVWNGADGMIVEKLSESSTKRKHYSQSLKETAKTPTLIDVWICLTVS